MQRACTSSSKTLVLGQRTYTIYKFFSILDANVAPPPHATWHARRVSPPHALQALTWRVGDAAHPCNERVHFLIQDARAGATPIHNTMFFSILDAKVAPPPHATWHARRVSSPPALQALTWRVGDAAHRFKEADRPMLAAVDSRLPVRAASNKNDHVDV